MFKLFRKKPNRKGFTLAELLVVVAIIAILVAIAIPIFTQSMKEAQIRTNEANIRSTKAAGVSEILADWDKYKKGSKEYKDPGAAASTGGNGWFAVGDVSASGDLTSVTVYLADDMTALKDKPNQQRGVYVYGSGNKFTTDNASPLTATAFPTTSNSKFIPPVKDGTASPPGGATPQVENDDFGFTAPPYETIVYISETEISGS